MLRTVNWDHGSAIVTFHAGEVLRGEDQRLAGGFTHVAVANGWAEVLDAPALTRAHATPRKRSTRVAS
jgi:hypothetical protein